MMLEDAFGDSAPVHVREGNRVSLLPITRFCGQAGRLSKLSGSSRAAVMSQWFHAHCAGKLAEADVWWSGLTADEREEVLQWQKPSDVTLHDGQVLSYRRAEKELEVTLDFGPVRSTGHLDMAWGPLLVDGHYVVYIGDIKKQAWTSVDGPDSLQLHGYGQAYARKFKADAYCTGIWLATEGEWRWSLEPIMMNTEQARQIGEQLRLAASNVEGEYQLGQHCGDCYGRLRCPQYIMAAADAPGWLEPMCGEEKDLGELDDVTLRDMLLAAKRTKDVADLVMKNIHALVDRGRRIPDPETGKVYASVVCKGRESVNMKRLRDLMGSDAEQYISRGASFSQHRWLKP